MRDYELIYIVHPDLDENAFGDVVERVQSWITASGGEIKKMDVWGKRRLAYPIRKLNEGQYVLVEAQIDASATSELERNLRFLEPIMRYSLIVK